MAQAPTDDHIKMLKSQAQLRLELKQNEFVDDDKTFVVPDNHWSGVMPEDYRRNLPGKKDLTTGEVNA